MAPDPLCGRARLEGNFDETVCAKTLYNYIDQGLLRVKNIDLPLRVRRKRKAFPFTQSIAGAMVKV